MNTKRGKQRKRPDYAKLQWKVYGKLAVVAACAAVGVVIFREYVRGRMGNFIVYVVRSVSGMSESEALNFYHELFTGKIDIYMYTAAIIAFIVVARFMMSQYARYFNEISAGLDTLVEDRDGDGAGGSGGDRTGKIRLSPEMAAMERKLNAIKQTLEKREHDAKQAEQRKNDLVTYLAHDIKTPLTSVIGYLSLLGDTRGLPEQQRAEYIRIALEKANRLEGLINEFFDITRYNLQTLTLTRANIDLYYMLVQMTDEFYPLLSAKGMEAWLHAAGDLTVYGDPDKLARVFNNILRNAVEYGPPDSAIDISAMYTGDSATITFRNAGSVPPDKLESIFDKFYRLDAARSTGTGGAGLGLAIARDIVTAHGGTIRADSAGGYTTFTVTLPAHAAAINI